jgi:hypothetical protein
MTKMNKLYIFAPLENTNELLGVVIKQAKKTCRTIAKIQ